MDQCCHVGDDEERCDRAAQWCIRDQSAAYDAITDLCDDHLTNHLGGGVTLVWPIGLER